MDYPVPSQFLLLDFIEKHMAKILNPPQAAAKNGKKKKKGGDDDDDSFIDDESEDEPEDISGDEESEADWVPSDDSD